jgi:hypothetical protein
MRFAKVLSIAALLCTSTAALALPSEAAPFFAHNSFSNNASCAPNYTAGYNYNNGFRNPYFNNRFGANQFGIDRQIQHGIANGSITRGEADRLLRNQRRLQELRVRLASNGLSFRDRARLNQEASRLEREVRVSMNNGNRRFW